MKKSGAMTHDLMVTGGHGILVDGATDLERVFARNNNVYDGVIPEIDDKQVVVAGSSNLFTKVVDNNPYNYYNFMVENDGDDDQRSGVWANGVLCETPSKNYFLKNIQR
jgi:hypothetical protein